MLGLAVALVGGALSSACSPEADERPPVRVAQPGATDSTSTDPFVTLDDADEARAATILENSTTVEAALGTDYSVLRAVPWTRLGSREIIGVVFEVATPRPVALPAGTPALAPQGEDADASTWSVESEPAPMPTPAASSFWVHVEFASGSVVSIVRSQPDGT